MQEYWSGLQFPSPGDLPDSGIEPGSPLLEADALTSEATVITNPPRFYSHFTNEKRGSEELIPHPG